MMCQLSCGLSYNIFLVNALGQKMIRSGVFKHGFHSSPEGMKFSDFSRLVVTVSCMRQTMLTQSRAPGCVISWSIFSSHNTFVDNYYRICRTFLIHWMYRFLPVLSLETSVCSVLKFCHVSWAHVE